MPTRKRRYQSYVQLFIPTRDKDGKSLSRKTIREWKQRSENLFQQFVGGYYISPLYRIEGAFQSMSGGWIKEHNLVIKAYAPIADCRKLLDALERDFIPQMGVDMAQESIAVETSFEGLAVYDIK
jgi:hypothetical protein